MDTVKNKLLNMGKQWRRAGANRFYFSDLEKAYGLSFHSTTSGKVNLITLDGKPITLSSGLLLRGKLALASVWFDTEKGTFHYKDLDKAMAGEILDYLRKEISSICTREEVSAKT